MKKIIFGLWLVLTSVTGFGQQLLVPQELKNKTVTVVVPYGAGGPGDIWNRLNAEQIKKITGLDIVIINKPGANGAVAAADVAQSKPNGLTFMSGDIGPIVLSPLLKDPGAISKDKFVTAVVGYKSAQGIFVRADSKYQTLADLANDMKTNPGVVPYGCWRAICNMLANRMLSELKTTAIEIPYKGGPQTMTDLLSGQIAFSIAGPGGWVEQVKAGKLRVLAWSSDHRLPDYPQVGLWKDVFPGLSVNNFEALWLPIDTPKHLVNFWNRAYNLAYKTDESVEQLRLWSNTRVNMTQAESERYILQTIEFWRPMVENYYRP